MLSRLLFLSSLLVSCAADPDSSLGGYPGVCSLNCAGAKIASNDMRVRFLVKDIKFTCGPPLTAGSLFPVSVPIRFIVEKPRGSSPAESLIRNSNKPSTGDEAPDVWTPVGGISFYPLGYGEGKPYSAKEQAAARGRWSGIITPSSNWCTDTCGVGSVEIVPACANYTLGIFSGGATAMLPVNIDVATTASSSSGTGGTGGTGGTLTSEGSISATLEPPLKPLPVSEAVGEENPEESPEESRKNGKLSAGNKQKPIAVDETTTQEAIDKALGANRER